MTDNLLPDIDVIWKPIVGFENYECTIDGRVRNAKTKRRLNLSIKKRNKFYTLSQNNKQTQIAVSNCIKLAYPETVDKPACHCCGKEYYNTGYVNYCSKECKAENYKKFKAEYLLRSPIVYKPIQPTQRICKGCGSPFIKKGKGIYCNESCRKKSVPKPCIRFCKGCGNQLFVRYKGYCSDSCRPEIDKEKANDYRRKARREGRLPYGRAKERAIYYGVEYKHVPPKLILDRDNWTYYICNDVLNKEHRGKNLIKSPELDHVIPISLGGPHIESNLACICRACNIKKSNKI